MKNTLNRFAALSLDAQNQKDDEQISNEKEKQKTADELTNGDGENNITANGRSSSVRLRWPLVWIDLEMTGLDVEEDKILEIACTITDGHLSKLVEGPDLIINQPEDCLAKMNDWCQEHHNANGLVEAVRKSKVTTKEAEQRILDFVQQHTGPSAPSLAGNSVYVDFMFLKKHMPRLAAAFSHVVVDISSIKALCFRWYPKEAEKAPAKKGLHRARDDIKESIEELKYLRRTIFKNTGR